MKIDRVFRNKLGPKTVKPFKKHGFVIIELLAVLMLSSIVLIIVVALYQEISFGKHTGTIVDKRYHAAYVSYTSSNVNGSYVHIPTTYPQRWTVKIQKNNKTLWIDVSEKEYNKLNVGDCYNCENK